MLIIMAMIMMSKLKNRFDDIYGENKCILWTVFITQEISLFIMTLNNILYWYWQAYHDALNGENQNHVLHYSINNV